MGDLLEIAVGKNVRQIELYDPLTVIVGYSENPDPIIYNSDADVDFYGMTAPLSKPIAVVGFRFKGLLPVKIENGIASFDWLLYLNGRQCAASSPHSENLWSQYGCILKPYLGEEDLTQITLNSTIDGKGISAKLSIVQKPCTKSIIEVKYPFEIPQGIYVDAEFPSLWRDNILGSRPTISTAAETYVITARTLDKEQMIILQGFADKALSYNLGIATLESRQVADKIKKRTLINIKNYMQLFAARKRP